MAYTTTVPLKILAFDIETIPHIAGLRQLHHLSDGLSDDDVFQFVLRLRREQSLSDFLPHYLQQVIAISFVYRQKESDLHIGSIGNMDDEEPKLLEKFFQIIDQRSPTLVSWNGGGFDLPVLQHRALIHGISAYRYWNMEGEAKWHNYINRYQLCHIDLMDVLARYQSSTRAPLSDMAALCGFPGKLGMNGSMVWEAFQQGHHQSIRHYCETDALNTYLLFLRFQLSRGLLTREYYKDEIDLVKTWLSQQESEPWPEFFEAWKASSATKPF